MTQSKVRSNSFLTVLGLSLLLIGACENPTSLSSQKNANHLRDDIKKENLVKMIDPLIGRHEQDSCTPVLTENEFGKSDCEEGLVCAPDVYEKDKGHCRVPCGVWTEDTLTKDKDACPAGRSCQILTSLQLHEQGAFCLPKQRERDAQCLAVFDSEACSNSRSCLPSSLGKNAGVISAKSFVCRNTCPYGEKDAHLACAAGESCMPSPAGKTGICGQEITWASSKDFTPQFAGKTCNEISGHQFCNTSLLAGLKNAAEPTCFLTSAKKSRGICFALCSLPALDMDGDGQIGLKEAKKTLACPAHYTCSVELGRELGLVRMIPDIKNHQKTKPCDLVLCPSGQPCPSQCGPGEAECLTIETATGVKDGVCGAPFGSCEPNES